MTTNRQHRTDRYRAGIVGLGFIGGADQVSGDALGQRVEDLDGTHVMALRNHDRVDLVAGSSRDEGRRQRFHERFDVPVFDDWRRMLDEAAPLDIVGVATYTPAHAEVTHAALAAGARVIYCEKPVAPTVAEAQGMLDACRDAGALLVINHNLRFHPSFRRLRDLIAAGGLGTLTSVTAQWPTGRLGNVGTHMFDAVQMVTGLPVTGVSGTLDLSGKPDCRGDAFQDPGGWGVLHLGRDLPAGNGAGDDGPSGELHCVVNAADYGVLPLRLGFHGTEGYAVSHGRDITVVRGDEQETWPNRFPDSGMDRAVVEAVAWLDDDGAAPFSYDAAEAVRTLEAILGFHLSHERNGARVDLPLTGDDRHRVLRSG
jgi:predicted dehydrogenase